MLRILFCRIFLSTVALFFSGIALRAQDSQLVDSLRKIIQETKNDSLKVVAYNTLAWELQYSNPDSATFLSQQALLLSQRNSNFIGEGKSYHSLGSISLSGNNYRAALNYFEKALLSWRQLEANKVFKSQEKVIQKHKAATLSNMGLVHWEQGEYPEALKFYFESLKMSEELGNKKAIANTIGNIGLVYWNQKEFDKALEYYFRATDLEREMGNVHNLASNYGNIGLVYCDQEKFDLALKYHRRALAISDSLGDSHANLSNTGNIGMVYYYQSKWKEAEPFYSKALKIAEELGDEFQLSTWTGNNGVLLMEEKKYEKAEELLLRAAKISEKIQALPQLQEWDRNLSELYTKTGQYDKALKFYKDFISVKDSIFNEDNTKKTVKAEMNFEFEKKEATTKAEQEKKEALTIAEKKKQTIIIWSVSGVLLLVLGFAVFAYRSFIQKRNANIAISKQKHIIEEKQKEILDSIRYAKRIQQSLLPQTKYIEKNLTRVRKKS